MTGNENGGKKGEKGKTHHLHIHPHIAQFRRGDDGDGAAEAVARRDDLVTGVLGDGGGEGGEEVGAQFAPGGVEAVVDEAGGAEVRGDEGDEGVDDVVLARGRAADGEDEEGVGGVDGEVGGDVAEGGAGG